MQYRNTPFSTTSLPQYGHFVGFSISFESLLSSATPVISGITSLERLKKTLAPILNFFFWISSKLFRVARRTVTPPKSVGSTTAIGLSFADLDTCHSTLKSVVLISSGLNLYAKAHFGNFSVKPISSLSARLFTLNTIPSIGKSKLSLILSTSSAYAIASCSVETNLNIPSVSNPSSIKNFLTSSWVSKCLSEYPTLYAKNERFLDLVTSGSRFLNAPAAPFLGFLRGSLAVLLYSLKALILIMPSPCISILPLYEIVFGNFLMVLTCAVMISPISPLPLVVAFTILPFS